jgi:uncharacterized protein
MKDTLQFIIAAIVDNPDAVSVEEQKEDDILNLIITVDQSDMGKVIGKEGKVIRSIRNIMKIKAMKYDQRIKISLAEQNS